MDIHPVAQRSQTCAHQHARHSGLAYAVYSILCHGMPRSSRRTRDYDAFFGANRASEC